MDKKQEAAEHALPSYEHEGAPHYEDAPPYDAAHRQASSAGLNLTLDPTGTFIISLPSSDAPPLYTLSKSLLHASGVGASIHVQRTSPDGKLIEVFSIGEHWISPLHTRKKDLQQITAYRSHGMLVTVGVRKVVWDFSTHVAAPKGETFDPSQFPVDPVYMIGSAPGPGTVQKHLLIFKDGKWEDGDDNLVALEREGGEEVAGMPVLSVKMELEQDMLDFLVSAWCVTLWGEVGKRARKHNK
jgi:hypothetical protein